MLDQRHQHIGWHNAPVASFGPSDAKLLIVGLAPGLKGANRTGRPFTGDHAGKVLYSALLDYGLAVGEFRETADDDLVPAVRITNAVRCVPPQNKPSASEIATCNRFLTTELTVEPVPRLVLALGRIAHEAVLRALSLKRIDHPFVHGCSIELKTGHKLLSSYHFSRYNINTGRMTYSMVNDIMSKSKQILEKLKENK